MNNARRIVTTPTEEAISNGLQRALEAAQKLAESRCKVIGAYVSPTDARLQVVNPPPFVTGGVKRRYRNPDGSMTHVMATRFFGVQLEWLALAQGTLVVGHA